MLHAYVFELGERAKDSLEEAREGKVGLSLVLLLVSLICHDGHFCLMFCGAKAIGYGHWILISGTCLDAESSRRVGGVVQPSMPTPLRHRWLQGDIPRDDEFSATIKIFPRTLTNLFSLPVSFILFVFLAC